MRGVRSAQDDDVRLQGFIRGVALVSLRPRYVDIDLLLKQSRIWSLEQIRAWERWTRWGMDGYVLFLVLLGGLTTWAVIHTDVDALVAPFCASYFIPMAADSYRARRGWL